MFVNVLKLYTPHFHHSLGSSHKKEDLNAFKDAFEAVDKEFDDIDDTEYSSDVHCLTYSIIYISNGFPFGQWT